MTVAASTQTGARKTAQQLISTTADFIAITTELEDRCGDEEAVSKQYWYPAPLDAALRNL